MSQISTYVFLDLEATGIPREEQNRTRITEISLIAVKTQHLLECKVGEEPRVEQKITLCLNPYRPIHPESTNVTGLCNFLLQHEPVFNEKVVTILQNFFDLLTKPVCLIGQNGFGFDFPLLQNHLVKLNMSFDNDLLCADSLYAFHDIIEKIPPSPETTEEPDNSNTSSEITLQQINEITPKKQKIKLTSIGKAKRRLFWGGNVKPKMSYKLKNIYKHLLKVEPEICHRAEVDTSLLIKCAVAVSKEFVEWVGKHHCLFKDIKPMTIGVPIGQ